MKKLLFTLLLLFKLSAFAQADQTCFNNLSAELIQQHQNNVATYGEVRQGLEPVLLQGTNTEHAIILVHGFIASPWEVGALGRTLNQKGYTVYMPLLPGFGGTADMANTIMWQDWAVSIKQSFQALAKCYPKVSMGGFSLGGEVISYLALKDEEIRKSLKSLVLLAPAIRLKNRFLLSLVLPIYSLFDKKPKVAKVNGLANFVGVHDINIPTAHPEFYNDRLPLNVVKQMKKLGRRIKFSDFSLLDDHNLGLIFSGYDRTVNAEICARKIKEVNEDLAILKIAKEKKVRHQIIVPDGNIEFDKIISTAVDMFEQ